MEEQQNRDSGGKFLPGHKLLFKSEKKTQTAINNLKDWIGRVPPMLGKHHSEETKEKMRLKKIGYVPWNKGNVSPNIYENSEARRSPIYKNWSKKVKDRDGWKCMVCGSKEKLIAHHILGYTHHEELRYDIKNGITLCQIHHPRKREDEERLIPEFQKLVGSYEQ